MLGRVPLWETAQHCHQLLREAGLPHAVAGGVAVCLHGYRRNTTDLDILIRQSLISGGYTWNESDCEFLSPQQIPVPFLPSGSPTGKSGSGPLLPDPSDESVVATIEELPVLTLARLIESKIACGQDHVRRTHKDFADVVELIDVHQLGRDYARFLHKSVRKTFRELVLRSRM